MISFSEFQLQGKLVLHFEQMQETTSLNYEQNCVTLQIDRWQNCDSVHRDFRRGKQNYYCHFQFLRCSRALLSNRLFLRRSWKHPCLISQCCVPLNNDHHNTPMATWLVNKLIRLSYLHTILSSWILKIQETRTQTSKQVKFLREMYN